MSCEARILVIPLTSLDYLGSLKDDKKWDAEGEHLVEEVKELGRSKWSDDLDDGNAKRTEATKRNLSSVSGLIKAYAKGGKSVHWGDQVCDTYWIWNFYEAFTTILLIIICQTKKRALLFFFSCVFIWSEFLYLRECRISIREYSLMFFDTLSLLLLLFVTIMIEGW